MYNSILLSILSFATVTSLAAVEGASIHGQILDENGVSPMAGLWIYCDSKGTKVTQTDAMGRFDYPIGSEPTIHILPYSSEVVGRSVIVSVAEFKDKVIRFSIERGVNLEVRVKDRQGNPLANATVSWQWGGAGSGTTNERGTATIGRISRFKNGDVVVKMPGCKDVKLEFVNAEVYARDGIDVVISDSPLAEPQNAQTADGKF